MLVADGNEVLVCSGAGFKAGFDDDEIVTAPAEIASGRKRV